MGDGRLVATDPVFERLPLGRRGPVQMPDGRIRPSRRPKLSVPSEWMPPVNIKIQNSIPMCRPIPRNACAMLLQLARAWLDPRDDLVFDGAGCLVDSSPSESHVAPRPTHEALDHECAPCGSSAGPARPVSRAVRAERRDHQFRKKSDCPAQWPETLPERPRQSDGQEPFDRFRRTPRGVAPLLKPRYELATTISAAGVSLRRIVRRPPPIYPNDTINGYNVEVLSCHTPRLYRS
jgi:hypothetical protein